MIQVVNKFIKQNNSNQKDQGMDIIIVEFNLFIIKTVVDQRIRDGRDFAEEFSRVNG